MNFDSLWWRRRKKKDGRFLAQGCKMLSLPPLYLQKKKSCLQAAKEASKLLSNHESILNTTSSVYHIQNRVKPAKAIVWCLVTAFCWQKFCFHEAFANTSESNAGLFYFWYYFPGRWRASSLPVPLVTFLIALIMNDGSFSMLPQWVFNSSSYIGLRLFICA